MPKTVRRAETCGHCDGEGYNYYCDDYLEGACIAGWDVSCDDCKGKGFLWKTVTLPDPKWAKLWKLINKESANGL